MKLKTHWIKFFWDIISTSQLTAPSNHLTIRPCMPKLDSQAFCWLTQWQAFGAQHAFTTVQGLATYGTALPWHARQFPMARRSSKFYTSSYYFHTEDTLTLKKSVCYWHTERFETLRWHTISKRLPPPALNRSCRLYTSKLTRDARKYRGSFVVIPGVPTSSGRTNRKGSGRTMKATNSTNTDRHAPRS